MAELIQERKDADLSFESCSEKVWLEGEDVHLYSQDGKVNNWCDVPSCESNLHLRAGELRAL